MRVRVGRRAKADLQQAAQFYEAQSPGLGNKFRQSILAELTTLQTLAGIHAREYGYQRLIASTFPFVIYYELIGSTARVVAIIDCRRDPQSIARRLQN